MIIFERKDTKVPLGCVSLWVDREQCSESHFFMSDWLGGPFPLCNELWTLCNVLFEVSNDLVYVPRPLFELDFSSSILKVQI